QRGVSLVRTASFDPERSRARHPGYPPPLRSGQRDPENALKASSMRAFEHLMQGDERRSAEAERDRGDAAARQLLAEEERREDEREDRARLVEDARDRDLRELDAEDQRTIER